MPRLARSSREEGRQRAAGGVGVGGAASCVIASQQVGRVDQVELGGKRAAERIGVEAQHGEPREAANLGRDGAAELIVPEGQPGELRVLEELGRYRAIEALAVEVQEGAAIPGAVANRGRVPADGDCRQHRARQ